jgi:hypothetical protein
LRLAQDHFPGAAGSADEQTQNPILGVPVLSR